MTKLDRLHEYRDTLLRIKNEGLVESGNFDMRFDERGGAKNECGTVCCVYGYNRLWGGDKYWYNRVAESFAINPCTDKGNLVEVSAFELLFGARQGYGEKAWQRQMRRINFLIAREERYQAFMAIPSLSKKERREEYARLAA